MKKILLGLVLTSIVGLVSAKDVTKLSSGDLVIDEATVTFKGKKVPVAEDSMYVSVQEKYKIDNKDVVLISQGSGGNACPATYFFLTVEGDTAKKSVEFGTCSDIPKIKQEGNTVVLTMPKMQGKGMAKYVYDNGIITENGKVLKK
jgi:hypothetical protein